MKYKKKIKLLLGAMVGVSLVGTPLALVKISVQEQAVKNFSFNFDNQNFNSESELNEYVNNNYKKTFTSDIKERNYVLNQDGSKSYLSETQLNSLQSKIDNNTTEKTILAKNDSLNSGIMNGEVGELSPVWFEQNQIDVTKPINFWRSDKNGITREKADALDSFMNSGYEVYYFNDIFFKSKNDLYKYLVNNYFPNNNINQTTSFRIKAPNGEYSKIISTSAKTDWKKVATTFIQDNCKPLVKIDLGDGNYKFISPDNKQALSKSIRLNDIPFIRVKANSGRKNFVIGLNEGDAYNLSGPLYYQGFQNIRKGISNKDNWVKSNVQFSPEFIDEQIKSINNNINNFFAQYIKDDGNITKVDAVTDANNKDKYQWSKANDKLLFAEKISTRSVDNFYTKNDVSSVHGSNSITINESTLNSSVDNYESKLNDVVYKRTGIQNNNLTLLSKNLQDTFNSKEFSKYSWIYQDTLAAANNFRTMKQYNILMKVPLLYNFMMDKLISAGAPSALIKIVRDYFEAVATIFTSLVKWNLGKAAMRPAPKYESFGELDFVKLFNLKSETIDFNIEKYNTFFAIVYPGIGTATAISKEIKERIMLGTEPTIKDIENRSNQYLDTFFKNVDTELLFFLKKQFVEIGKYILDTSFNISRKSELFDDVNFASYTALVMSLADENQLTYRDEILDVIQSEASELLNSPNSWELVSNDNRFKTFAFYIQETTGINVTPNDFLATINTFDYNTLLGWNNAFLELEYNLRTDSALNNIANTISEKSLAHQYIDHEMDGFDRQLANEIQQINDKFHNSYFGDFIASSNVDYIFKGIFLSFEQFASITLMRMLGDLSETDSLFKFDKDCKTLMINDKYATKATKLVHSMLTSNSQLIMQLGHLYRSFQAVQQAIDACAEQYEFSNDKQFSLSPIAIKLMLQNTSQYASIINQNIDYLQSELKSIGVPLKVGQIIAYSGSETINVNNDLKVRFEPSFKKEINVFNSDSKIATDIQSLIPYVNSEQTTYVVPNMDVVNDQILNINPLVKSYLIPVALIDKTPLVNSYEYSLQKYFDLSLVQFLGFNKPNMTSRSVPYFNKEYRFHINEQVPSDKYVYLKKWGSINHFVDDSISAVRSSDNSSGKRKKVLGVRRRLKNPGVTSFKAYVDDAVFQYQNKRTLKTVYKVNGYENINEDSFDLTNDFIEQQQINNKVKTITSVANKLISTRMERANPSELSKEAIAKANEVDFENRKSGKHKRYLSFELMNVINNTTINSNNMIAWSLSWIENKQSRKNNISNELRRVSKQLVLDKFNEPLVNVLKNDAYIAAMDYEQLLETLSFNMNELTEYEQYKKILNNIDILQKYLCDIGENSSILSLAASNNAFESKLLKTAITGVIDSTLSDDEKYKKEINKIHEDYSLIANEYWKEINRNFLANNFDSTTDIFAKNIEDSLFGSKSEKRKLVTSTYTVWIKEQNKKPHIDFMDVDSINPNAENWKKLNAYIKPQKEIDDLYLRRTYNNNIVMTKFYTSSTNSTPNFDELWSTKKIKEILNRLIKKIKSGMKDNEKPSATLTYYEDLLAKTILDVEEEPWKIDDDSYKYIRRLVDFGNLFTVTIEPKQFKISTSKITKPNKTNRSTRIIKDNTPEDSLPSGYTISKTPDSKLGLFATNKENEIIYYDQNRTWYKIDSTNKNSQNNLYFSLDDNGEEKLITKSQWDELYSDNASISSEQSLLQEDLGQQNLLNEKQKELSNLPFGFKLDPKDSTKAYCVQNNNIKISLERHPRINKQVWIYKYNNSNNYSIFYDSSTNKWTSYNDLQAITGLTPLVYKTIIDNVIKGNIPEGFKVDTQHYSNVFPFRFQYKDEDVYAEISNVDCKNGKITLSISKYSFDSPKTFKCIDKKWVSNDGQVFDDFSIIFEEYFVDEDLFDKNEFNEIIVQGLPDDFEISEDKKSAVLSTNKSIVIKKEWVNEVNQELWVYHYKNSKEKILIFDGSYWCDSQMKRIQDITPEKYFTIFENIDNIPPELSPISDNYPFVFKFNDMDNFLIPIIGVDIKNGDISLEARLTYREGNVVVVNYLNGAWVDKDLNMFDNFFEVYDDYNSEQLIGTTIVDYPPSDVPFGFKQDEHDTYKAHAFTKNLDVVTIQKGDDDSFDLNWRYYYQNSKDKELKYNGKNWCTKNGTALPGLTPINYQVILDNAKNIPDGFRHTNPNYPFEIEHVDSKIKARVSINPTTDELTYEAKYKNKNNVDVHLTLENGVWTNKNNNDVVFKTFDEAVEAHKDDVNNEQSQPPSKPEQKPSNPNQQPTKNDVPVNFILDDKNNKIAYHQNDNSIVIYKTNVNGKEVWCFKYNNSNDHILIFNGKDWCTKGNVPLRGISPFEYKIILDNSDKIPEGFKPANPYYPVVLQHEETKANAIIIVDKKTKMIEYHVNLKDLNNQQVKLIYTNETWFNINTNEIYSSFNEAYKALFNNDDISNSSPSNKPSNSQKPNIEKNVPDNFILDHKDSNVAYHGYDKSITIKKVLVSKNKWAWTYSYNKSKNKVLIYDGKNWCKKDGKVLDGYTPLEYKILLDNAKMIPSGFKPIDEHYPIKLQYKNNQIFAVPEFNQEKQYVQYKVKFNDVNNKQVHLTYNGSIWIEHGVESVEYKNFDEVYNKYFKPLIPSHKVPLPEGFELDRHDKNKAYYSSNKTIVITIDKNIKGDSVWTYKYNGSEAKSIYYDKKVWHKRDGTKLKNINPIKYKALLDNVKNFPQGFAPIDRDYPFELRYKNTDVIAQPIISDNGSIKQIVATVIVKKKKITYTFENSRWYEEGTLKSFATFDDVYEQHFPGSTNKPSTGGNAQKIPPYGFELMKNNSNKAYCKEDPTIIIERINIPQKGEYWTYFYNGDKQRVLIYDGRQWCTSSMHSLDDFTPLKYKILLDNIHAMPKGFSPVDKFYPMKLQYVDGDTIVYAYPIVDVESKTVDYDSTINIGGGKQIKARFSGSVWVTEHDGVEYKTFDELFHHYVISNNVQNNRDLPRGFKLDPKNKNVAYSVLDNSIVIKKERDPVSGQNMWFYRYKDSSAKILIYKGGRWCDKSHLPKKYTPVEYKFLLENIYDNLPNEFIPFDEDYPDQLRWIRTKDIYAEVSVDVVNKKFTFVAQIATQTKDVHFEYNNGKWIETESKKSYNTFSEVYEDYKDKIYKPPHLPAPKPDYDNTLDRFIRHPLYNGYKYANNFDTKNGIGDIINPDGTHSYVRVLAIVNALGKKELVRVLICPGSRTNTVNIYKWDDKSLFFRDKNRSIINQWIQTFNETGGVNQTLIPLQGKVSSDKLTESLGIFSGFIEPESMPPRFNRIELPNGYHYSDNFDMLSGFGWIEDNNGKQIGKVLILAYPIGQNQNGSKKYVLKRVIVTDAASVDNVHIYDYNTFNSLGTFSRKEAQEMILSSNFPNQGCIPVVGEINDNIPPEGYKVLNFGQQQTTTVNQEQPKIKISLENLPGSNIKKWAYEYNYGNKKSKIYFNGNTGMWAIYSSANQTLVDVTDFATNINPSNIADIANNLIIPEGFERSPLLNPEDPPFVLQKVVDNETHIVKVGFYHEGYDDVPSTIHWYSKLKNKAGLEKVVFNQNGKPEWKIPNIYKKYTFEEAINLIKNTSNNDEINKPGNVKPEDSIPTIDKTLPPGYRIDDNNVAINTSFNDIIIKKEYYEPAKGEVWMFRYNESNDLILVFKDGKWCDRNLNPIPKEYNPVSYKGILDALQSMPKEFKPTSTDYPFKFKYRDKEIYAYPVVDYRMHVVELLVDIQGPFGTRLSYFYNRERMWVGREKTFANFDQVYQYHKDFFDRLEHWNNIPVDTPPLPIGFSEDKNNPNRATCDTDNSIVLVKELYKDTDQYVWKYKFNNDENKVIIYDFYKWHDKDMQVLEGLTPQKYKFVLENINKKIPVGFTPVNPDYPFAIKYKNTDVIANLSQLNINTNTFTFSIDVVRNDVRIRVFNIGDKWYDTFKNSYDTFDEVYQKYFNKNQQTQDVLNKIPPFKKHPLYNDYKYSLDFDFDLGFGEIYNQKLNIVAHVRLIKMNIDGNSVYKRVLIVDGDRTNNVFLYDYDTGIMLNERYRRETINNLIFKSDISQPKIPEVGNITSVKNEVVFNGFLNNNEVIKPFEKHDLFNGYHYSDDFNYEQGTGLILDDKNNVVAYVSLFRELDPISGEFKTRRVIAIDGRTVESLHLYDYDSGESIKDISRFDFNLGITISGKEQLYVAYQGNVNNNIPNQFIGFEDQQNIIPTPTPPIRPETPETETDQNRPITPEPEEEKPAPAPTPDENQEQGTPVEPTPEGNNQETTPPVDGQDQDGQTDSDSQEAPTTYPKLPDGIEWEDPQSIELTDIIKTFTTTSKDKKIKLVLITDEQSSFWCQYTGEIGDDSFEFVGHYDNEINKWISDNGEIYNPYDVVENTTPDVPQSNGDNNQSHGTDETPNVDDEDKPIPPIRPETPETDTDQNRPITPEPEEEKPSPSPTPTPPVEDQHGDNSTQGGEQINHPPLPNGIEWNEIETYRSENNVTYLITSSKDNKIKIFSHTLNNGKKVWLQYTSEIDNKLFKVLGFYNESSNNWISIQTMNPYNPYDVVEQQVPTTPGTQENNNQQTTPPDIQDQGSQENQDGQTGGTMPGEDSDVDSQQDEQNGTINPDIDSEGENESQPDYDSHLTQEQLNELHKVPESYDYDKETGKAIYKADNGIVLQLENVPATGEQHWTYAYQYNDSEQKIYFGDNNVWFFLSPVDGSIQNLTSITPQNLNTFLNNVSIPEGFKSIPGFENIPPFKVQSSITVHNGGLLQTKLNVIAEIRIENDKVTRFAEFKIANHFHKRIDYIDGQWWFADVDGYFDGDYSSVDPTSIIKSNYFDVLMSQVTGNSQIIWHDKPTSPGNNTPPTSPAPEHNQGNNEISPDKPQTSPNDNSNIQKPVLPNDGNHWSDPIYVDIPGDSYWYATDTTNENVKIMIDVLDDGSLDTKWWHVVEKGDRQHQYIGYFDSKDGKWYKVSNDNNIVEYNPSTYKPSDSSSQNKPQNDTVPNIPHDTNIEGENENTHTSDRLQLSQQILDNDFSATEELMSSINESKKINNEFVDMTINGETGAMSIREMCTISGDHIGDYRYVADHVEQQFNSNALVEKYEQSQVNKSAISYAKFNKLMNFIDMFDFAFGIFQLVDLFKGIIGNDVTTTYTFRTDDAVWTWSGGLSHECSKNIITSSYDIRTASSMLMNDAIEISGTYTKDFIYWNGKQYSDDNFGHQQLMNDYMSQMGTNQNMISYTFADINEDVIYANEETLKQLHISDSKQDLVNNIIQDIEENGEHSRYITDSIKTFSDGFGGDWSTVDSSAAIDQRAREIYNSIRPSIVSMKPIMDRNGNLHQRRDFKYLPGNNYDVNTNTIITEKQKANSIDGFSTDAWFIIDNSANELNSLGKFMNNNGIDAINKSKQKVLENTKNLYVNNVESIQTYEEHLSESELTFNELKVKTSEGLRPIRVVIYHDTYGDRYFLDSIDYRNRTSSTAYQNIMTVIKQRYNIKLETSISKSAKYHYMGRVFDSISEMLEWSNQHSLFSYSKLH